MRRVLSGVEDSVAEEEADVLEVAARYFKEDELKEEDANIMASSRW